jgi:hypothetical protein
MNRIRSLSNEAKLNVTGLVLTAFGMLLQLGSGSELYPTLSGPIVLLVGAAIIAFVPGRWTAYVGLIIPVVLAAGLLVATAMSRGFVTQLTDGGRVGLFVGSLVHVAGLTAAVAGGLGMLVRPEGKRAALDRAG